MAVVVGASAPAFTLPAASGKDVSLADFAGRTVVLYFYPKDNTSGCTREACDFRDAGRRLAARQVVVLGVSPDSVRSHAGFRDKYSLPFLLLSDADRKVARAYGVWVKKSLYGREYMGIERSTFVIGPDGVVQAVFRKVKVDGHVDDVIEALAK
jgi:thioredoxin-dependent peroxiredoxin